MKMYSLTISAKFNNCENDMLLYSELKSFCCFNEDNTVWDWLHKHFPLLPWTKDDGEDFDEATGTDYCQYVSYPDTDHLDNYILATFDGTDD